LCKVFGKQDVRVLIPQALRDKVLRLMHGNRAGGHWCALRTAARLRSRYYWPGCSSDVGEAVSGCLDCKLGRLENPGLQARMVRSHPSRRFQIVAMDVLEMSPQTRRGNRKILVIGDVFSRFNVAVAIPDEKAETVARVTFDRWGSVFGPPEQLLTDLRHNFTSGVITEMCRLVGTRKSITSAYRPQTNGFLERYNRTLSTELSRCLLDEQDWDLSLSMVTIRYNAMKHVATGMTPYKAVLGTEVFEFDCGLLQRWRIDDEPENLAQRLAEIHAHLLARGLKVRDESELAYNRAVRLVEFDEGERVLVYDGAGAVVQGRKLRLPWLGPYRVERSCWTLVTCSAQKITHARRECMSKGCDGGTVIPRKTRENQRRGCGRIRDGIAGDPGAAGEGR
jgi:transposase InsO family protein